MGFPYGFLDCSVAIFCTMLHLGAKSINSVLYR